jgi:hypothetical protein
MKIDGTINKDYNGISVPQDGVIVIGAFECKGGKGN